MAVPTEVLNSSGRNFPSVRILALDKNYGYSGGNNRGIVQVATDIVVLLNNDMIVDRGFLKPLLAGFSDPSVFAVTSQIFFQDPTQRREETGKTRARFERGFFYLWHDEIGAQDETRNDIPVFWAGGGSCAIDRNKFFAIGGFDPLYEPFYLEDTDLSYQAWKRGWKCLLAPESRVVHKHRSTSRTKFGSAFVDNTVRKNQYLFIWKNVTDARMIFTHLLNLPRIHGRNMISDVEEGFEMRRTPGQFVNSGRPCGNALQIEAVICFQTRKYWSTARNREHPGPYGVCAGSAHAWRRSPHVSQYSNPCCAPFRTRNYVHRRRRRTEMLRPLQEMCESVIPIRRVPDFRPHWLSVRPFLAREFSTPEMHRAADKEFARKRVDVLQCEYLQMAQFHRSNVFTILTLHEMLSANAWESFRRAAEPAEKFKLFYRWMQMSALRNIDAEQI